MAKIQFRVSAGERLGKEARMILLYCGLSVRRLLLNEKEEEPRNHLQTTLSLLFVLQLLAENRPMPAADAGGAVDPVDLVDLEEASDALGEERRVLQRWNAAPLADEMHDVNNDWSSLTVSHVCQACLALGHEAATIDDLKHTSVLFFAASGDMLLQNMLAQAAPVADASFLTLGSVDFLTEANEQESLDSLVELAESEIGQQMLRDFILSYKLPRSIVGVRRLVLMTREANTKATEQFPRVLQDAHEAAMRGSAWEFAHTSCDIVKTCCLLAGFACSLLDSKSDTRREDAFGGIVRLPFLETTSPAPTVKRIVQIPATDEWVVMSIGRHQRPVVHLRDQSLQGLGRCLMLVTNDRKKSKK